MTTAFPTVRSAVDGVAWPALPDRQGAAMLGLQYQLSLSEWQSADVLERRAFGQIEALLGHCMRAAPFWAERIARAGYRAGQRLDAAAWARVPIITRREIQQAGERLLARSDPPGHGPRHAFETSGSTGSPVKGVRTAFAELFWDAITVRDHLWHGRDPGGRLAFIRRVKGVDAGPHGIAAPAWSRSLGATFVSGTSHLFHLDRPVAEQVTWLAEIDPDYLHTQPSLVREIVREADRRGVRLRNLRAVTTFGEVLDAGVRRLVAEKWSAPVQDTYSTVEAGFIALQCPGHEHYHVQSEACFVEIIDGAGRRCGPGQIGAVVVTPLHNFAMPLLRYAIGDYAEVGPPCSCGRGLPVLTRIIGRVRNVVRRSDGSIIRPRLDNLFDGVACPILQYQVVEDAPQHLAIRIVAGRPMSSADLALLSRNVETNFGEKYEVAVDRVDDIPRGAGGKFEDFISLVER